MSNERSVAVWRTRGSHSNINDVCVKFLTRTLGVSGRALPNFSRMLFSRSQNSRIFCSSSDVLRLTEMLTILPAATPFGKSNEGNSIRWWSSVSRIAYEKTGGSISTEHTDRLTSGKRRSVNHLFYHSSIQFPNSELYRSHFRDQKGRQEEKKKEESEFSNPFDRKLNKLGHIQTPIEIYGTNIDFLPSLGLCFFTFFFLLIGIIMAPLPIRPSSSDL